MTHPHVCVVHTLLPYMVLNWIQIKCTLKPTHSIVQVFNSAQLWDWPSKNWIYIDNYYCSCVFFPLDIIMCSYIAFAFDFKPRQDWCPLADQLHVYKGILSGFDATLAAQKVHWYITSVFFPDSAPDTVPIYIAYYIMYIYTHICISFWLDLYDIHVYHIGQV